MIWAYPEAGVWERIGAAFRTVWNGYLMIAEQYPENVDVTFKDGKKLMEALMKEGKA